MLPAFVVLALASSSASLLRFNGNASIKFDELLDAGALGITAGDTSSPVVTASADGLVVHQTEKDGVPRTAEDGNLCGSFSLGCHAMTIQNTVSADNLAYIQWKSDSERAAYMGWGNTGDGNSFAKHITLGLDNGYSLAITVCVRRLGGSRRSRS